MIPYNDPQHFKGQKANKKSDVYSIGVLLWEISSGKVPFYLCDSNQTVVLYKILEGEREIPVPGTPIDYINIYTSMKLYHVIMSYFINVY